MLRFMRWDVAVLTRVSNLIDFRMFRQHSELNFQRPCSWGKWEVKFAI